MNGAPSRQALGGRAGNTTSISELAKEAGASKRNIERLFLTETLMTFGKWRQQLRVLHVLKVLPSGQPVTAVAREVGYESTSAFINTFKANLGTTPARYYADAQSAENPAAGASG